MRMSFAVWFAVGACLSAAAHADQAWEIQGDFVALKSGGSEVVVLRGADGQAIEVPLACLSESSQAAVRRAAAAVSTSIVSSGTGGVVVRGPFGRMVTVPVPAAIKDVEADAIQCRGAADASDIYHLFLVGDRPTREQRAAAEKRLREWAAKADEGLVRLGDRWVPPAEAMAAAEEGDKVVDHALELMRLGNADLAEEELRKACRINPESGRASFIMGLSYALVPKNQLKAAEHFADVVHRDPENAAALADLAVLEVLTRRYGAVVPHFREALDHANDPLPIAENLAWVLKMAGAARANPALAKNRMPEKVVDELNALYRMVTQDLKLKPSDTIAAPRYLGPDGLPCSAASVADVARLFGGDVMNRGVRRRALGFVVAPERIVCPRELVMAPDGKTLEDITVMVPEAGGRHLTATVVAAPNNGDAVLLKCEGLSVDPLPLATTTPPLLDIAAVGGAGDSTVDTRIIAARGKVVARVLESESDSRFVHTAVVSRGLGGGPIVDAEGRVVGMVAATPRTDLSGNAAGFGLPVERIRAAIEEHLSDDAVADAGSGGDMATVERRALAGTVVVSAGQGQPTSGASAPGAPR